MTGLVFEPSWAYKELDCKSTGSSVSEQLPEEQRSGKSLAPEALLVGAFERVYYSDAQG
jgi:hypothetical protein